MFNQCANGRGIIWICALLSAIVLNSGWLVNPLGGILLYFILFLKIFGHTVQHVGVLVPWPGIEPAPHALEAQSLNHWTTRQGDFKKHPWPFSTPRDFNLIGLGWGLGIGIFKSSSGNSNEYLELETMSVTPMVGLWESVNHWTGQWVEYERRQAKVFNSAALFQANTDMENNELCLQWTC